MAAVVGVSNLHVYAHMRGQTLEEFQKTRNAQVLYSVGGAEARQGRQAPLGPFRLGTTARRPPARPALSFRGARKLRQGLKPASICQLSTERPHSAAKHGCDAGLRRHISGRNKNSVLDQVVRSPNTGSPCRMSLFQPAFPSLALVLMLVAGGVRLLAPKLGGANQAAQQARPPGPGQRIQPKRNRPQRSAAARQTSPRSPGGGGFGRPGLVTPTEAVVRPFTDRIEVLGTAKGIRSVTITSNTLELVTQVHFRGRNSVLEVMVLFDALGRAGLDTVREQAVGVMVAEGATAEACRRLPPSRWR